MIKLAITGPESSGKTWLANWLSAKLSAQMVEEQSRVYLMAKSNPNDYSVGDILAISELQNEAISTVLQSNATIVVCDTDFVVLDVWMQEVFGQKVEAFRVAQERVGFDVLILCKPDLAWEADPLRENEHDRDRLYSIYKSLIKERGYSYIEIEGMGEKRGELALEKLKELGLI
jgi:nicotinamide riboside kinase